MLDVAKMDSSLPQRTEAEDIAIGKLLAACDRHPATPLVFGYGGRLIQEGYHVTEVKAGRFTSLDCGGNAEAWPAPTPSTAPPSRGPDDLGSKNMETRRPSRFVSCAQSEN